MREKIIIWEYSYTISTDILLYNKCDMEDKIVIRELKFIVSIKM